MRKMLVAAFAASVLGIVSGAATAAPLPAQTPAQLGLSQGDALIDKAQYRRRVYRTDRFGRPVVVDRYYGRRGYYARPGYYGRRGYYGRPYRRIDPGAAAAAGIAGLATGAIIGGALANQQQALPRTADPDYIAYCSRKYRSFDPASGTYLGYDGERHACQYP